MMILTPSRTVLEPLFAVMAGDVSPKQWAAGAPVIGAASVPAEKPNRSFRLTIIRRVGRPAFLTKVKRKGDTEGVTKEYLQQRLFSTRRSSQDPFCGRY